MIQFKQFDKNDDRDYEAFVAVHNAVHPENKISTAFIHRYDGTLEPDFLNERILAVADRPVGAANFGHNIEQRGKQKFKLDIMVHPDYRHRGIGTELYDRVMAFLAPHQPVGFEAWTRENDADGMRFLEKRGFACSARQVVSLLDLNTFDAQRFAATVKRVTAANISVLTLGEYMTLEPDYQQHIYKAIKESEHDMPWYESGEGASFEFFAKQFDDNPDLLLDCYVVAIDRGTCVGLTQLWGSQATDKKLYTGYTGVLRSHRGRGVATAIKVKSLSNGKRRLASNGRAPVVETQNHETNPMLLINLQLGFVEQPASLVYSKQV